MSIQRRIQDVPGLAEKIAQAQRADRRRQWRYIAAILAGALVFGGAMLYAVSELGSTQAPRVVIDPATLPPIQRGPGR